MVAAELSRRQQDAIPTKEQSERIQDVVRVYPYGLRTAGNILADIEVLEKSSSMRLSLVEVHLGVKTPDSIPSPNMLTPFGGKIEADEDRQAAAIRELQEEAMLTVYPFREGDKRELKTDDSFVYRVPGYNRRRSYIVPIKVVNPSILSAVYPRPEKSKITSLVSLTLPQFIAACRSGEWADFKLVGSSTILQRSSDVEIKDDQRYKRDHLLSKVVQEIAEYDQGEKIKLRNKILLMVRLLPEGSREKLSKNGNLESTLLFLKKSLPEQFPQIFEEAYGALLTEEYMAYFREVDRNLFAIALLGLEGVEDPRERRLYAEAQVIRKRLSEGNLGIDILHFLPLGIGLDGAKKGKSTKTIVACENLMRDVLSASLQKTPYQSLNKVREFFKVDEVSLAEKLIFTQTLDKNIIENLAKSFGVSVDDIQKAWAFTSGFLPALAREMTGADPNLFHMYQFHEERNEVANASLAQIMLLALGVDTKENRQEWLRTKFEAFRKLVIFFKMVIGSPLYEKGSRQLPNPIGMAINDFFGPVINTRIDEYVDQRTGQVYQKPTERRQDRFGRVMIIDQKPGKTGLSFIRKTFESNPENIHDFRSVNIVLPDEEYAHMSVRDRIRSVNNIASNFWVFLQMQFPDWYIEVIDNRDTFKNYFDFLKGKPVHKDGLRTGSEAERILRKKICIKARDLAGNDYYFEMSFYPTENVPQGAEGSIMGYQQKIADDPSYDLRRMLYPLKNTLGLRSLYELFYPPSLYPEAATAIRREGQIYKSE